MTNKFSVLIKDKISSYNKKIKVLFRKQNNGKGANIKNALNEATGDLILFQDGDLEYFRRAQQTHHA